MSKLINNKLKENDLFIYKLGNLATVYGLITKIYKIDQNSFIRYILLYDSRTLSKYIGKEIVYQLNGFESCFQKIES